MPTINYWTTSAEKDFIGEVISKKKARKEKIRWIEAYIERAKSREWDSQVEREKIMAYAERVRRSLFA